MSSPVLIEQLNSGIDVILADAEGAIPSSDPEIAELLGLAAELRTLPRPDFRSQLKFELMERAFAVFGAIQPELRVLDAVSPVHVRKATASNQERILPTLSGQGSGVYGVRRANFALSAFAHAVALALVLTSGVWLTRHQTQIAEEQIPLIAPSVSDYLPFTKSPAATAGGGGGGDRDKVFAPQGHLPKAAMEQITPPEVVVRNNSPKLSVEATVALPPQVHLATNAMPNLGDPKSSIFGPPSNGTGSASGIGSGSGGGIGSGAGGGVGPGIGGGYGGGVFRVGGGVSAPRLIYKPDPEYSPEARQAKYQGTVLLNLIVDASGKTRGIRIVRSLGMGLDEKALEAVRQWRFEPALKDGKPVAVAVDVEVNFRLF